MLGIYASVTKFANFDNKKNFSSSKDIHQQYKPDLEGEICGHVTVITFLALHLSDFIIQDESGGRGR